VQSEEERLKHIQYLIMRQCTSKRAYSSKRLVKEAIAAATHGNVMLDYYQCSICAKYHTTTKRKGSPK